MKLTEAHSKELVYKVRGISIYYYDTKDVLNFWIHKSLNQSESNMKHIFEIVRADFTKLKSTIKVQSKPIVIEGASVLDTDYLGYSVFLQK